ncbi:hypothetical protein [Paucilactobacillus wasatchensis]|uniref:Uncharacterized protein n=1 Tax=Paucilactobacillus wasatchensis TaxID=1335616 RepID=A0A0D0YVZ5_9LACO|nr:hypothetical protein [Paucilactobacillus wasatchensis]KIS03449.1 hypothetical protein WDC_0964 [Paucilactobacillus wasatchensis]
MENYQSPLKKVSSNLRDHFDEFFLENDRDNSITRIHKLPQMPVFQRNLFLQRSIKKQATVNLQLTSTSNHFFNVRGQLKQITTDQLILTTETNVTYLFKPDDIRYLALT